MGTVDFYSLEISLTRQSFEVSWIRADARLPPFSSVTIPENRDKKNEKKLEILVCSLQWNCNFRCD